MNVEPPPPAAWFGGAGSWPPAGFLRTCALLGAFACRSAIFSLQSLTSCRGGCVSRPLRRIAVGAVLEPSFPLKAVPPAYLRLSLGSWRLCVKILSLFVIDRTRQADYK